MKKVVKFGGSSLASARQFKKVKAIIDADKARGYVVPLPLGNGTERIQRSQTSYISAMRPALRDRAISGSWTRSKSGSTIS